MPVHQRRPQIPLPKRWASWVKSAVPDGISVAHYATGYTPGRTADRINPRVRLVVGTYRLKERIALLEEGLGIKNARRAGIPPDNP